MKLLGIMAMTVLFNFNTHAQSPEADCLKQKVDANHQKVYTPQSRCRTIAKGGQKLPSNSSVQCERVNEQTLNCPDGEYKKTGSVNQSPRADGKPVTDDRSVENQGNPVNPQ